jgi:sugar phosphate isomerase/epimerase
LHPDVANVFNDNYRRNDRHFVGRRLCAALNQTLTKMPTKHVRAIWHLGTYSIPNELHPQFVTSVPTQPSPSFAYCSLYGGSSLPENHVLGGAANNSAKESNPMRISRRQMLGMMGAAALSGAAIRARSLFGADATASALTTQPATLPAWSIWNSGPVAPPAQAGAQIKNKRFKVAADDEFLNNYRQDLKEFPFAQKAGLDGIVLDMGHMPGGKVLQNHLVDPAVREQFLAKSRETGVEIACLGFLAMYAWVVPHVADIDAIMHNWVDTLVQMGVKMGFMPLMTPDSTLAEASHAAVVKETVALFKRVAPYAEKQGVILSVESNVNADGYKKFLDAVGSPAVRVFYDPGVGLENKFDVYQDIKDLGNDRVCALRLQQGSVAPEKFEHRLGDGLINFPKLRETLMEMNWGGWMSIARSRLKGTERKAMPNMTANAAFVHKVFPE